MNLARQSKEIACVLSLSDYAVETFIELQDALTEYLNINADTYFFIWHLLDVDDDGKPKTPHIHLVARMNERKRLGTFVNDMRLAFGLNKNAISMDKPTSFDSCVQYLIHKNNPEKYQYLLEDVYTNVPRDELAMIMESDSVKLDAETLIKICKEEHSLTSIMLRLGLGLFNHYRPTIKLIFEEVHPFVNKNGEVKSKNIRLN